MINLEQFISLCNLEGAYFIVTVEEREDYFNIVIGSSPRIGITRTLNKLEPYYNKIVKNVSFDNENNDIIISVEVE